MPKVQMSQIGNTCEFHNMMGVYKRQMLKMAARIDNWYAAIRLGNHEKIMGME